MLLCAILLGNGIYIQKLESHNLIKHTITKIKEMAFKDKLSLLITLEIKGDSGENTHVDARVSGLKDYFHFHDFFLMVSMECGFKFKFKKIRKTLFPFPQGLFPSPYYLAKSCSETLFI